ncbi:MAG: hypothetical protein RR246_01720, partial [Clostridia bacterium]
MKNIQKSKSVLELDKVIAQISQIARTEGSSQALLSLEPSGDIVTVKRLLSQTAKAKEMIVTKSQPPFGRCRDILSSLDRA